MTSRSGTLKPFTSSSDGWGACVRRLMAHVDCEAAALTGSVAIDIHLSFRSMPRSRSVLKDVDIVACQPEAIRPTVTGHFLVSHFHLAHAGYPKFMPQLVDVHSRLRVDIFPAAAGAIECACVFDVGGMVVQVLDPDAILDHKLALLAGASAQRPVDRKHYEDAILLGRLCGRTVVELPPAFFASGEHAHDVSATCVRCDRSVRSEFRLAPKQQIFDVLGYV